LKSLSKQIIQLWEEQHVSDTTSGGGSSSNPSEPNRPHAQQPAAQVAFSIPTSAMPPPNLTTLPPDYGRSRIRTDSSPLLTLSKSMHNNKDSDNNGNHGNNTKNVQTTNPFLPAPAFSQPAPPGITRPPTPPSPSRGHVSSKAEIDLKWSLWFARHHRNMLLLSKGEALSSVHSDTLDCLYDYL
jgi:hypothetical protein